MVYQLNKIGKYLLSTAAGALFWAVTSFGTHAYAQEPKPQAPPEKTQAAVSLEKKADEAFKKYESSTTPEDKAKNLKETLRLYEQAEDVDGGLQYGDITKALKEKIAEMQPPQPPAETEQDLVKKAEELFTQYQALTVKEDQLKTINQILDTYKKAEEKTPGDQYKDKIDYFTGVLATISGQQGQAPSPAPGQPNDTTSPSAGQTTSSDATKKSAEGMTYYIHLGGGFGINHSTKTDRENASIRLGDWLFGDAILDYAGFRSPNDEMMTQRTYAGTASAGIPGFAKVTLTGDNTEERNRSFQSQLYSDSMFDITTDTNVKAVDANQFFAGKIEASPIAGILSGDATIFDHIQKITTNIDIATYVKNKTIPNGDYSESASYAEESKIRRRGGQGIARYHLDLEEFKSQIGLLVDLEKTEIEMHGKPKESITAVQFGLEGRLNLLDIAGATFILAQKSVDASSTTYDQWNSVPAFAAVSLSTPKINIGSEESPLNFGATVFGTIRYLDNRHLGGRLGGVISIGADKSPVDFLNDYFSERGREELGLRRELSDRLAGFDAARDLKMLPWTMQPPKDLSIILFGEGGCYQTKNLNNEEVQANFGSIGALFRNPYVSVGGTASYFDDTDRRRASLDAILQFHKLGNIILIIGAYEEKRPRMRESDIGGEASLVIPLG